MSLVLDRQRLEYAFQGRPDIIGAIQQAAAAPNWIELFNEISSYVSELRTSSSSFEPVTKKRKIDEAIPNHPVPNTSIHVGNGVASAGVNGARYDDEPPSLQIKDISLVIPQRKKFTLELTHSYILARHPETQDPIQGIGYAWKDIDFAFCLPVPEKAQKQYNYILFPKRSNKTPRSVQTPTPEPLVFTIPITAPKPGTISGPDAGTASSVSDSYKTLFDYFLSRHLKAAGNGVSIVEANEKHFASVIKEPHRPNEKAVHVKGFRGSKDGFIFFLSTGILWGFKKPLLFLPKERISAVSYTSVLQRTFNLNIDVHVGTEDVGDDDIEEFEFAMLDQEDFAGIDTYVKRHGLQDKSMAEQRRAKRLGVNVVKGEDGTVTDVGDAGELEKAEQELQDEEDEEEEDYDPGSEGDSEGEGSSSGEEDADGGGDAEEEVEDEDGGDEEVVEDAEEE